MQEAHNQVKTRPTDLLGVLGARLHCNCTGDDVMYWLMLDWRAKQDHVQIGGMIGERTEVTPSLQSTTLWICPAWWQIEVTPGNNGGTVSLGTGEGTTDWNQRWWHVGPWRPPSIGIEEGIMLMGLDAADCNPRRRLTGPRRRRNRRSQSAPGAASIGVGVVGSDLGMGWHR
jgi:hypothetical protein